MKSLYNAGMKILATITIAAVLSAFPFAVHDARAVNTLMVTELPKALVSWPNYEKERLCLQKNIYFEARNQGVEGMKAVAAVTMNRIADSRWPDSVCAVVYQRSQFSWTRLVKYQEPRRGEREYWDTAGFIADQALAGDLDHRVEGAVYFHTLSVSPAWSRGKKLIATIGDHKFFK